MITPKSRTSQTVHRKMRMETPPFHRPGSCSGTVANVSKLAAPVLCSSVGLADRERTRSEAPQVFAEVDTPRKSLRLHIGHVPDSGSRA